MTPLERAARALANLDEPDKEIELADDAWRQYVPDVRALLQSIREPSEAMLDAACVVDDLPRPNPEAVLHWQAMIDAALEEV